MKVVKTKSTTSTWLGREGTVHSYHFDKNRIGKRVCFHVWKDTGMMDISVLKGTFWRGDGTEKMFFNMKEVPLPVGTMEVLAENLAEVWFRKEVK